MCDSFILKVKSFLVFFCKNIPLFCQLVNKILPKVLLFNAKYAIIEDEASHFMNLGREFIMLQERTRRPLYTITEGYDGEFVKYDITSFTKEEIDTIKRSFSKNEPDKPVFVREAQRAIYAIDTQRQITYQQPLTHGLIHLEVQCIDDIRFQGELVYYLVSQLRHVTDVFWEDSRDQIGFNLMTPNSVILIFCSPSTNSSRIKYIIPNITGQQFSGDVVADFIETLDNVYPQIQHPYACLYGLTPEAFQAYGKYRCFRPNYIR